MSHPGPLASKSASFNHLAKQEIDFHKYSLNRRPTSSWRALESATLRRGIRIGTANHILLIPWLAPKWRGGTYVKALATIFHIPFSGRMLADTLYPTDV